MWCGAQGVGGRVSGEPGAATANTVGAHKEMGDGEVFFFKQQKREAKKITTPGVPRLSPTLVLTRPEEA